MKNIKRKSIITAGIAALSVLALGIGISMSSADKAVNSGFKGSYDLTAYAEESSKAGVSQITVADKVVDITSTATFISTDEKYTLCLTVIDLADFGENFSTPLQIGYEIAESAYYNGITAGLSSYVYSSITFGDGETKLSVSDLSLGTSFKNPYFIVAEVSSSSIDSAVLNCIVAVKHNLEYVEGTASTCSVAGNLAYYHCTDDGCDKYFTDSLGLNEIADLSAWKVGDGKLALEAHNPVAIEAQAPTCTESGLTAGSYCSVCGTILVAQNTIQASGHTEVTDEAVAATCTETGLTAGSHCSECGETLVAQQVTDALGHKYDNHICSRCGDLEMIAVDGVYYQLTAADEKYDGYHFVACGKAAEFNSLYCGKELVLKNVIDGYPVTEIGESAFENTDDNPIKSVILPANITYINNLAFAYNYGMESAVFLANTVNISGSFKEGEEGNNTPFYGCTTSSGATKTEMSIYFNTIIYNGSSTDLRWTRLWRFEASWLIYHRHFIGNDPSGSYNYSGDGTLYSNSLDDYADWSYVNLTVNNNTGDSYDFDSIAKNYVTEGLVATVYNAETLCKSIQAYLEVLSTTQEKCLKYKATVTITKDSFGTTQVVVDVDVADTIYYLLTLSSATTADDGSAVGSIELISGDYKVYNEATYAANVTLTAEEVTGYKFVKYVSNGVDATDNPYTISLDTVYDVSVYYEATTVTINVISAVEFSHAGKDFSNSETGVTCVIDKDNVDVLPTSTGYIFLGWAKVVNESLEFTTITTENGATYYAIWANNSKANLASITQTTSGTIVESTSVTATDGTLYAWYTDNTFATQVTAISATNTVLYARMQYTVGITFDGSSGSSTVFTASGGVSESSTSEDYTLNISVLEGDSLTISLPEQSGKYIFTTYKWNNLVVNYGGKEITVSAYKSGNDNNANRRTFTISSITKNGETESVSYTTGASFTISDIRSTVSVGASF
ncbi:MAG: hypothetical protein ACI4MN_04700 [Candidatus Coproplasma sp.]